MKILITGGGTGGHLYPALAVAEALGRDVPKTEILFVGAHRGLEAKEVPEAGFEFRGLDSVGFPRRPGLRSLHAGWALSRALLEARSILREFRPDVVFSTGGYASAPVVTAAWAQRVPVVLQEQNSIPGRTNRIASRFAEQVHLAYASARLHFPRRGHLRLTGNPLRAQVTSGSRGRALRQFRLEDGRKTVLVLGGSQGARPINQAVCEALRRFEGREDLQLLIQSGAQDHEWVVEQCRAQSVKTWVRRFIPNIWDAYELADLIVARGGAMSLAEITACGVPSILVPYPYAMDDHQRTNAQHVADNGAAVLVPQSELTPDTLAALVDELLGDPRRLREMSVHALSIARPDATERLVAALLRFDPEAVPELAVSSRTSRSAGRRDDRGGGRSGRRGSGEDRGGRGSRGGRGRRGPPGGGGGGTSRGGSGGASRGGVSGGAAVAGNDRGDRGASERRGGSRRRGGRRERSAAGTDGASS